MGEFQAFEWIFETPQAFLFLMTFIMMIGTFAATRMLRSSILIAIMSLVYASYSDQEYFVGLMYLLLIAIAVLVGNQLFGFILGDNKTGEI